MIIPKCVKKCIIVKFDCVKNCFVDNFITIEAFLCDNLSPYSNQGNEHSRAIFTDILKQLEK